jgi:prolyl oligopeptidase
VRTPHYQRDNNELWNARLLAQNSATSSSYHGLYAAGGKVFALYDEPPKQQPKIAVLTNAADPALARTIVDPNAMNPQGTTEFLSS